MRVYTPKNQQVAFSGDGWIYVSATFDLRDHDAPIYNGLACAYSQDVRKAKRYQSVNQVRRDANKILTRPRVWYLSSISKVEIIAKEE